VNLAELSDADLVARCRSGDRGAWNELVERFSRYVYAIAAQAYRLPAEDADDVFQETFSRVYEHLSRLRSDEAIRPWIGQLTRRLCVDRLRAARYLQQGQEPPEPADLDARLEGIEEALTVQEALSRLNAARSSIASSRGTRATARSERRSSSRSGRSPVASPAASRACGASSREAMSREEKHLRTRLEEGDAHAWA